MTDPATSFDQFRRALIASAKSAGVELYVAGSASNPWASALFTGARHTAVIAANCTPAFHDWVAGLGSIDIAMPRQFVASIDVTEIDTDGHGRQVLTIEVLTVAE